MSRPGFAELLAVASEVWPRVGAFRFWGPQFGGLAYMPKPWSPAHLSKSLVPSENPEMLRNGSSENYQ